MTHPNSSRHNSQSRLIWVLVPVLLVIGVLAVGFVAGGLYLLRSKKRAMFTPPMKGTTEPSTATTSPASTFPLSNVNVSGTLCGKPVTLKYGSMGPHAITLKEEETHWGSNILLFLFLRNQSPEGKQWVVPSSDKLVTTPHVHFHCKTENNRMESGVLTRDYKMKLVFGTKAEGRIPVSLELEEPAKGIRLSGSFDLRTEAESR